MVRGEPAIRPRTGKGPGVDPRRRFWSRATRRKKKGTEQ